MMHNKYRIILINRVAEQIIKSTIGTVFTSCYFFLFFPFNPSSQTKNHVYYIKSGLFTLAIKDCACAYVYNFQ